MADGDEGPKRRDHGAWHEKTLRVIIKQAPLVFRGCKGRGLVSIVEETPRSREHRGRAVQWLPWVKNQEGKP